MILLFVSTLATGIFAGAAIYVNAVEHPARLKCGTAVAIREFAASYPRASVMQATLAVIACVSALIEAWVVRDLWIGLSALLIGAVIPFTLVVIFPVNRRLLDPAIDPIDEETVRLFVRWSRLHAVRSVLAAAAFFILLTRF